MRMIPIVVMLALVSCVTTVFSRNRMKFGNQQSSFVLGKGGKFIGNTYGSDTNPDGYIIIEGGGFTGKEGSEFSGCPVKFKDGVLTVGASISNFNGVLDLQENIVKLVDNDLPQPGGTLISNPGGLYTLTTESYSGFNILRGQPLFNRPVTGNSSPQPNAVQLKDTGAVLSLGIQNTLNTNVILNGGGIVLEDDLRFGDLGIIKGGDAGYGSIVFNSRRLSLGGTDSEWDSTLVWNSAHDLQLNSAVTLTGKWAFTGPGQINGNGNVIDIRGGGTIYVLRNPFADPPELEAPVLRLAGVHIKGLGSGRIVLADTDSTLILTDTVIEMDDDYSFTNGTVLVEGSSTIITRDHILSFTDSEDLSTNGKLIVDRVSLTYDTQATLENKNIRPTLIEDPRNKYVEVLGGGEIRTFKADSATFRNYQTSGSLQKYAIVANYRPFVILPVPTDNPDVLEYNVTVDGNTNFLGFTRDDVAVFFIADGVQARMTRIVLRDLSPKHISLGTGSSLTFADKTTVSLARNEVLNDTWVFEGETILKGGGNILELGPNGVIELRGENSQLLLDGIILKGISGNNIRCTSDTSTIQLKGVKWIQSADATYSVGSLEIMDDISMSGPYNFTYASPQPLTILSNATLTLNREKVFTYQPSSLAGNLFTFADSSGAFMIDSATLAAPNVAMQLDGGRFIVRGRNFARGAGITLGSSLTTDQPSGATIIKTQALL